jgi:4-hydroxysphinganine ceramide fatty acyl 2-hydroxylase
MFDNPILENGSKTPWWIIPIAYLPIEYYFISHFSEPLAINLAIILLSIGFWSLSEYLLHRFVFHGEDYWMRYMPHTGFMFAFHFTIHGIHHCFPMDRYRLVFPPVPGHITLYLFFYIPAMNLMPQSIAYPFLIGNLIGYQMYDLLHYSFHHFDAADGSMIKRQKIYHLQHHYKFGTTGFGVSSKLWDVVFDTKIEAGKSTQATAYKE